MTKDQAIALATQRDYYKQACERLTAELDALKKPAPNCRTCLNRYNGDIVWMCDRDCTNGDKYQEATKVVLWRTE